MSYILPCFLPEVCFSSRALHPQQVGLPLSGDPKPEIKKSFLDLESKIPYSNACCSSMYTWVSTDSCTHLCYQRPGHASKLLALRSHSQAPCHLQPPLLTWRPQPSFLSPSAVLGLSLLICSHILFPTSSLAPSIHFPHSVLCTVIL